MALIVYDYLMPDETTIPAAYVRVKNILIENNDYELLEPAPNSDDLMVKWLTKMEGRATVYVYADAECRKNNVTPIHWFVIDVELIESDNIFGQVYRSLSANYLNVKDC